MTLFLTGLYMVLVMERPICKHIITRRRLTLIMSTFVLCVNHSHNPADRCCSRERIVSIKFRRKSSVKTIEI